MRMDLSDLVADADAIRELMAEHRILMEAIQQSPVHFCVYDAQDRLIAWNQSYEANYPDAFDALRDRLETDGVTYADLMRFQLSLSMSPEDVEAEVERRLELQSAADGEPVLRSYGDYTLRVHKYRLPSGAVAGLAVDITDLVHRETELRDARHAAEQKEKAKAVFLANMSHEIRTPMNGILGLAELLAETSLTDEQRELVGTIIGSSEALMTTINEILDFSKIDAGKLDIVNEPFDLRGVLRDLADLLRPVAAAKNVTLSMRLPADEVSWYVGDAVRLRQCLLNLMGNAIKFTRFGRVTVTVGHRTDGFVHFSVTDTGIGIAPEYLETIFAAFRQADPRVARQFEGTGLGLSITRRLVELMGGRIRVESELGVGSSFRFSLPLEQTAPVAEPGPPVCHSRSAAGLSHLDILLVEDNATNQLVFEKMLSVTKAQIRIVANGQEAVDAFLASRPDIIFMDMSMPVMSGLEATELIRAQEALADTPPTQIIALTANAMVEDKVRCLETGMNAVLTKPISRRELLGVLQTCVQGRLLEPVQASSSARNC